MGGLKRVVCFFLPHPSLPSLPCRELPPDSSGHQRRALEQQQHAYLEYRFIQTNHGRRSRVAGCRLALSLSLSGAADVLECMLVLVHTLEVRSRKHSTGRKGDETQEPEACCWRVWGEVGESVRSSAMRWLPPFANVVCEWSVKAGMVCGWVS